jgi:hypothetical protein
MGTTYDYYVEGNVSISQIQNIYKLSENSFFPFRGFSTENFVRGYFHPETLPALMIFNGFDIKDISTHGTIKKKNKPLEKLEMILVKGEYKIKDIGLISINWQFKEKASAEMKRCNDSFRIELRRGKCYFGYYSNGSKVGIDHEYAKKFMQELKTAADLPLEIIEAEDHFLLEHSMSGELSTPRASPGGKNPSAFICEMKNCTVHDLFTRMKSAFESVGTDNQSKFSWGASTGAIDDHLLSKKIYDCVYENAFPADKYDIDLEFSLKDLRAIEDIRSLCGPKDKVFTEICSFNLSEDNYANVQIITSQFGHRVCFELRLPEDTKQIRDKLGVKIDKSYFA